MMKTLFLKAAPWLAGAGMAGGHAAIATHCTVPKQGTCVGCCSCLVVVASLATWAIQAKKQQQAETTERPQSQPAQLSLTQPQVAHSEG